MDTVFVVEREQCLEVAAGTGGRFARPAWSATFSSREKAEEYVTEISAYDRALPSESKCFVYTIRQEYCDPPMDFCRKILDDWEESGEWVATEGEERWVPKVPQPLVSLYEMNYNASGTPLVRFESTQVDDETAVTFEGKFRLWEIVRIVFDEAKDEQRYGIAGNLGVVYWIPNEKESWIPGVPRYYVRYVNTYGRSNSEIFLERHLRPYEGELPEELAFLGIYPDIHTGKIKLSRALVDDIVYGRALVANIESFDFSRSYDLSNETGTP